MEGFLAKLISGIGISALAILAVLIGAVLVYYLWN